MELAQATSSQDCRAGCPSPDAPFLRSSTHVCKALPCFSKIILSCEVELVKFLNGKKDCQSHPSTGNGEIPANYFSPATEKSDKLLLPEQHSHLHGSCSPYFLVFQLWVDDIAQTMKIMSILAFQIPGYHLIYHRLEGQCCSAAG